MISVMNNDRELDKRSDRIEESQDEAAVLSSAASGSTNEENRTDSGAFDGAGVSSMEFDSVAPEEGGGEVDAKFSENERSEEVRVRDYTGSVVSTDREMDESRVTEVKEERIDDRISVQISQSNDPNDQYNRIDAKHEATENTVLGFHRNMEVEKYSLTDDKSLWSEFDDYVANDRIGGGTSRALSYGFEVGDMVWGKVKSHPWWPGHIFNEAFASPSVRRTRREGHVLVAFFGDSSYGWFDPAELIPFDAHFAEKSQQTTSRNFVKAVEEAMDETSRRRALGLACKCRNPYNFRPTNVQGYVAVDVLDYEPGGVYSVNQIRKARNNFKPKETLAFVKEVALAPHDSDLSCIEFIKNRATVSAFRKQAFEEFDETYAQAFGVQPSRPSSDLIHASNQPVKEPPRAPLSGPLVIAEALGGAKGSKKPMKVKDNSKKDRYLFKRRDEPIESRNLQSTEGQASSSSLEPAFMEGAFEPGDYVLQKRAPVPQFPSKHEQTVPINWDGAVSGGDVSGKEILAQAPSQFAAMDVKPSFDKEKERIRLDTVDGTSPAFQHEDNVVVNIKHEEGGKPSGSHEGLHKPDLNSIAKVEGGQRLDQVHDSHASGLPFPDEARRPIGMSADGGMKKVKVLKRPLGDLGSENSALGEKKKKKKKKEGNSGIISDHLQKRLALAKGGLMAGNLVGKSNQAGLPPREESQLNHQRRDVLPASSLGTSALELPQLLDDLCSLALDPFHGIERNCPTIVRKFFLRYRSLVYQKSLVLSPSESEPVEIRAGRPPASGGGYDNPPDDNARESMPSKHMRVLSRPDDPTKAGRKRLPSDRQEEIAAKKMKKMSHLKSLTAEKKSSQRILEAQRVEGKEQSAMPSLAKPLKKPDSVKKTGPPSRAVEPTMLVMKFPPQTSLPSVAELKAKFGRFGSLDQTAIRVFWKTSTCRVVFRYKVDAQAAYRYANGNNSLFGNLSVRYHLRSVEVPGAEVPEADKSRADDTANEMVRVKDPAMVERGAAAASVLGHQPFGQAAVQLKSCLKKPTNEEVGQVTGGNGGRGTPRVKFMLGGEESTTSRGEQMMVGNRNNFNNNASFADGGTGAPSSVAMDFNSKNFQKVVPTISPSPPPILPLPQFSKAPVNNMHHTEVVLPRNTHNINTQTAPPSATSIDISQQMLSLLTRCNDVVSNVTNMLGYVPYHPL